MAINPINTMRITGMASGLDTETMVENMLQIDRARIDKQFQTKTKLEWKADALREVNSLIKSFREKNMSVLNASSNMLSMSAYSIFDAKMLTSTSAVSVSAGASAAEGKITIDSITRLASSALVKSKDVFNTDINRNAKLSELAFAKPLVFDAGTGKIAFSINGKEFSFTAESTLNDVISKVNTSDAGVKMSYSSLTKGFSITSTATGSASKVEIVNSKGNAFADTDSAFGIAQGTVNGQDALLKIEGVEVTKSSNSFTIDGITYNLSDTSSSPISFNVERNIDATVDKVKDFVDSYNELVDKLQGMLKEEVHRNYLPLTDAQKDEMTEKEIEMWEDRAKSGLLYNDSGVSSMLSQLRSALYTTVEGTGMKLFDVGLTTGAYYDGAKIKLDEDKLRSAIEKNPDAVANLFVKTSRAEDSAQAFKESGLIVRLSNSLLDYTKKATDVSLDMIADQISDAEDRMDALEQKRATKEANLWRRFTAMETAMSKLNSQTNWLTLLFTTGS